MIILKSLICSLYHYRRRLTVFTVECVFDVLILLYCFFFVSRKFKILAALPKEHASSLKIEIMLLLVSSAIRFIAFASLSIFVRELYNNHEDMFYEAERCF